MMDDKTLNRLRLLESELLHLRQAQEALTARTYEVHEMVCEILHSELASPLQSR